MRTKLANACLQEEGDNLYVRGSDRAPMRAVLLEPIYQAVTREPARSEK